MQWSVKVCGLFWAATMMLPSPGEARNGAEAVPMAADLVCDAIVMDINMPEMNGIEQQTRMKLCNLKLFLSGSQSIIPHES